MSSFASITLHSYISRLLAPFVKYTAEPVPTPVAEPGMFWSALAMIRNPPMWFLLLGVLMQMTYYGLLIANMVCVFMVERKEQKRKEVKEEVKEEEKEEEEDDDCTCDYCKDDDEYIEEWEVDWPQLSHCQLVSWCKWLSGDRDPKDMPEGSRLCTGDTESEDLYDTEDDEDDDEDDEDDEEGSHSSPSEWDEKMDARVPLMCRGCSLCWTEAEKEYLNTVDTPHWDGCECDDCRGEDIGSVCDTCHGRSGELGEEEEEVNEEGGDVQSGWGDDRSSEDGSLEGEPVLVTIEV